jgi:hypothetical protein
MRWHYQTDHGGWPLSMLERLGLSDLRDRWPAEIVAPGQVIGPLTEAAARHLGLRAGLPVVQGGADAFIGMIGLGVTRPGDLALITGSSHLQLGVAERPVHAPGIWATYMDCVYPGLPIIEGGQTSTGSVIAWFKRHFAEHLDFDTLNAQAAALPPGAEGLLAVDHFQGNRTPHTDALAWGAITGLSLKHTPAHVYRINNQYGMGTRVDRSAGNLDFPARAAAFGLAAARADGADVEAVHDAARALVADARQGRPGFLEIDAYRFYGHARMDKSPYRTAEEEAEGRRRDPVARARARLLAEGLAREDDLARIDAEAGAEMDAALAHAIAAPAPALTTMFEDVYAPGTPAPRPQARRLAAVLAEKAPA